jgi:molecular chaperone DnaK
MTMPADAPESYTAALRRAAGLAGLEVVRFVAEPVAGAIAAGHASAPGDRLIAVCDFGGGTFDAALVRQHGLRFETLGVAGDPFLGGDDLDLVMADGIDGLIFRQARTSLRHDAVAWAGLIWRCESVKRQLSRAQEARIFMRDAYAAGGSFHDLDFLVDRSWIAPRWAPLVARAVQVVRGLLASLEVRAGDVDEVCLIGGTMMSPAVHELFGGFFGRRVAPMAGADLAVVRGAAMIGSALARGGDHFAPGVARTASSGR